MPGFPAFVALLALLAGPAAAQMPQDRPIRMISGFAAGGSSDFVTRVVADAVGPILGQRVMVENRSGVNGTIGAAEVARSAPDGTTVYQCPMSTLSITPQLQGANLPLDPGAELAPIATVALSSYGLVVSAKGPYRSIADLIAAAKQKPGQVSFGSAGVGSAQHLSGELLARLAGVQMVHIPYRGATPAILDILGGRTDFMITNLGDMTRQVQAGELTLLAIGDDSRSSVFPDMPPLARSVPGFNVTGWFGICGPKGMPAPVLARWEGAIRQAMQDPAVVKRLADNGLTPHFEDAATLAHRLDTDRRTWLEVIRAVNARAE